MPVLQLTAKSLLKFLQKKKLEAAKWDNKKEVVKGNSIEVKAVNKVIEDTRFRIRENYRMLQDKGELITGLVIKTVYLGVHALQKGHTMVDLVDYYEKIWKPKHALVDLKITLSQLTI